MKRFVFWSLFAIYLLLPLHFHASSGDTGASFAGGTDIIPDQWGATRFSWGWGLFYLVIMGGFYYRLFYQYPVEKAEGAPDSSWREIVYGGDNEDQRDL